MLCTTSHCLIADTILTAGPKGPSSAVRMTQRSSPERDTAKQLGRPRYNIAANIILYRRRHLLLPRRSSAPIAGLEFRLSAALPPMTWPITAQRSSQVRWPYLCRTFCCFAGSQTLAKSRCRRRDLNPRPPAYEADALPLSYAGRNRATDIGVDLAWQAIQPFSLRRVSTEQLTEPLPGIAGRWR